MNDRIDASIQAYLDAEGLPGGGTLFVPLLDNGKVGPASATLGESQAYAARHRRSATVFEYRVGPLQ